jgi:hypothetical protein
MAISKTVLKTLNDDEFASLYRHNFSFGINFK